MNQEKVIAFEKEIEKKYSNTAGIVVLKNGETVYESYFDGCTAADPIHVASVTKSIVSALVGIAIGKGYIKSCDQKVLEFFPDYVVAQGEITLPHVTIRHMLTMTAPYKCEAEPYEAFFTSENWLRFALDLLGGDSPIGAFTYSPIVGIHILSGILAKATGCSVFDFAAEHLFTPLGITVKENKVLHNKEEQLAFFNEKSVSGWVADRQGINTAGWGLTLTPVDMAKIGQLYLNGGIWGHKQVVPAPWIDESTKEHSRWSQLPYGYLWWIMDDKERIYAALGDGGNVIYVNTKKKMVVAIASLFMPNAKDRIELIQAHIEPLF